MSPILPPSANGPLKLDRDITRCGYNFDYGPEKQCIRDTTHFIRDMAAGGAWYFLCEAHARKLEAILTKAARPYIVGEQRRSLAQLRSELHI